MLYLNYSYALDGLKLCFAQVEAICARSVN